MTGERNTYWVPVWSECGHKLLVIDEAVSILVKDVCHSFHLHRRRVEPCTLADKGRIQCVLLVAVAFTVKF